MEKTKINQKEVGIGPFFKLSYHCFLVFYWTYLPILKNRRPRTDLDMAFCASKITNNVHFINVLSSLSIFCFPIEWFAFSVADFSQLREEQFLLQSSIRLDDDGGEIPQAIKAVRSVVPNQGIKWKMLLGNQDHCRHLFKEMRQLYPLDGQSSQMMQ